MILEPIQYLLGALSGVLVGFEWMAAPHGIGEPA